MTEFSDIETRLNTLTATVRDQINTAPSCLFQQTTAHEGELDQLESTLKRLQRPFVLGVVGPFRAGKSSLINALVGEKVAPTDVLECTASINEHKFGESRGAEIFYKSGSSETVEFASLHSRLRRPDDLSDVAAWEQWMKTIDHCSIQIPSDLLRSFTIWDSPGLGGSDMHDAVARRFIEQVDAALWVFDIIDGIGDANVRSALEEISQRGKPIIPVLNKAESKTARDVDRVIAWLRQTYKGIRFQEFIPFSAAVALGTASKIASSAVPDDGGKKSLFNYLSETILTEPKKLVLRGIAGDLSRIAASAQDRHARQAAEIRRMLSQTEQHHTQLAAGLDEEVQSLTEELTDGVREEIIDKCLKGVAERLTAATVQQLLNAEWRERTCVVACGRERIQYVANDYLDKKKDAVTNRIKRLVSNVDRDFRRSQTPFEVTMEVSTPAVHAAAVESDVQVDPANAAKAAAAGGAVALVAAIPLFVGGHAVLGLLDALGGCGLFTLAGALVSGALMLRHRQTNRAPDVEMVRSEIMSQVVRELNLKAPELTRQAGQLIERDLKAYRVGVLQAAEAQAKKDMLRGRPVAELQANATEHERASEGFKNSASSLAQISGGSSKSSELPTEAVTLNAGDTVLAQTLLQRVFSSAGTRVAIVDTRFNSGAFEWLRLAPESLPVQLLTFEQPMSPTLRQPFVDSLARARRRPGSVRVRVPIRTGDRTCPVDGDGAWIFTEDRCFHLSHSLSALGSIPVTLRPEPDEVAARAKHFTKWWEQTVSGVQVLDVC